MSVGADQITDVVDAQDAVPERGGYRVEYLTADGGGHIVVGPVDRSVGIVEHAVTLLREQGIDARIRRIVPLRRGLRRPGRAVVAGVSLEVRRAAGA